MARIRTITATVVLAVALVLTASALLIWPLLNPRYVQATTSQLEWPADTSYAYLRTQSKFQFLDLIDTGISIEVQPGLSTYQAADAHYAATATIIPAADHTQFVIAILTPDSDTPTHRFGRGPATPPPAMRIALRGLTQTVTKYFDGPIWADQAGRPAIIADLDRTQAEYVRSHGVPDSLIEEMLTLAERFNWQRSSTMLPPIMIEPSPHFQ